ncbi:hypothetical protein BB561_006738 [Smittium simulii]|uniref:Uncharacterized protein n=1 Tax=Smittium simulii TaxID=133385 RepID=A0A2T9Y1X5_9FUNG|nr:hypothetical protein BB561_006738 [Smittium simulii]
MDVSKINLENCGAGSRFKRSTQHLGKTFKNLAAGTTGNSKNSAKLQRIFTKSTSTFSICESIINWAEIVTALKDTPNNKASGADTVAQWNTNNMDIQYCSTDIKKKMTVRVGKHMLPTIQYSCGVRQGCLLSLMLFNMFINNIFDGVDGAYVPGLGKYLPGLLFADNVVVLAELSDKLQIVLDAITK